MPSVGLLDLRASARALAPEIEVPEHLRAAAISTWRGRMVNEHGSARVFEGLARQLGALGLDPRDSARLARFADEERRHGVLCGAVVEALGGEAVAPALEELPFPEHAEVGALEGALRNLLSVSCLSETVAVALVGAERLEMPEGPLRALLTEIYADECGHANFGWRLVGELLAGVDSAMRERLAEYLVVAFAHLEQHELRHLPVDSQPPAEGAALGLCNGLHARALFRATVEGVILPGLEARGLAAHGAWARRHEAGRVV